MSMIIVIFMVFFCYYDIGKGRDNDKKYNTQYATS